MLVIFGDIHGNFRRFKTLLNDVPADATVIQVGDFGLWPQLKPQWDMAGIDRDVFFIDGNHDYHPFLALNEATEIWPHAIFIPRGWVMELSDHRVLFLGGSKSVDRKWRRFGSIQHGWFLQEQLTDKDVELALINARSDPRPIDLMITHAPPDCVIRKNFSDDGLIHFEHDPKTWVDESALLVEKAWRNLGSPRLICGHMHRSVIDGNVQILGIEEKLEIQ